MSYRDMRNFTEMMRSLGFTRHISMENFRNPNFPLVAEILRWLMFRYDQQADVPVSIDTEQDRVIFIKMVAHFMATRTNIRLNTKRLYQADGYAVKELIKVAGVLYAANRRNSEVEDASESSVVDMIDMTQVKEVQEARALSSQITSRGAALYDLLGREVELRQARLDTMGRQLEIVEVERGIRASIRNVDGEIKKILAARDNVASDEANLQAKIEKKHAELERNKKRLSTLQSVRPAYMDEFQQLEEELSVLYTEYITRFRNLNFLETQYDDYIRVQLERHEESELTLKKMVDEMNSGRLQPAVGTLIDGASSNKGSTKASVAEDERDDFRGLLDDDDGDEDSEEESESEDEVEDDTPMQGGARDQQTRRPFPVGAGGQTRPGAHSMGSNVGNFGSMVAGEGNDEDLVDDDEGDDLDEDSDEEEGEAGDMWEDVDSNGPGLSGAQAGRQGAGPGSRRPPARRHRRELMEDDF